MEENKIEIKYIKPSEWRKFMARFIDAIVFVILFGALFIPMRNIVTSSESYKEANSAIETEQLASGLYKKRSSGEIIDIITYYNEDAYTSISNKVKALDDEIKFFIDDYCVQKTDSTTISTIKENQRAYFLDDKLIFDGQKYFIEDSGTIVRNPDCTADSQKYFDNVYSDYFDLYLQGYFTKLIPDVYEQYKVMNNMVIFLEIPIPVIISSFLTYILPTFIFKRNRYTLGRLSYKIGLIDENCLAVKTKKVIIKNLILYFGEILLSIVTFGLPIIISYTISVFSKKKQTFSEYMTNVVEIDSGHTKVYFSKEEIKVDQINTAQKAVDFKS